MKLDLQQTLLDVLGYVLPGTLLVVLVAWRFQVGPQAGSEAFWFIAAALGYVLGHGLFFLERLTLAPLSTLLCGDPWFAPLGMDKRTAKRACRYLRRCACEHARLARPGIPPETVWRVINRTCLLVRRDLRQAARHWILQPATAASLIELLDLLPQSQSPRRTVARCRRMIVRLLGPPHVQSHLRPFARVVLRLRGNHVTGVPGLVDRVRQGGRALASRYAHLVADNEVRYERERRLRAFTILFANITLVAIVAGILHPCLLHRVVPRYDWGALWTVMVATVGVLSFVNYCRFRIFRIEYLWSAGFHEESAGER